MEAFAEKIQVAWSRACVSETGVVLIANFRRGVSTTNAADAMKHRQLMNACMFEKL
jgi:hypothetical protein